MTLESLLDTLTTAVHHTTIIKHNLNHISKELVSMKADITTMIVTAKDNVKARVKQLEEEQKKADANVLKHKGECFSDVDPALRKFLSDSPACHILAQTQDKTRQMSAAVTDAQKNF